MVIQAHIPAESLREIKIWESTCYQTGRFAKDGFSSITRASSYHVIQPLQSFSQLTSLCFSPTYGVVLDDNSFIRFITCFPHLRSLILVTDEFAPDLATDELPTLHVFPLLLRLCPCLEEISMSVNATYVPEMDKDRCPLNQCIRKINLMHSPVTEDHSAVAEFLHTLFPNLVDIDAGMYRQFWDWEKIRLLVSVLAAQNSNRTSSTCRRNSCTRESRA